MHAIVDMPYILALSAKHKVGIGIGDRRRRQRGWPPDGLEFTSPLYLFIFDYSTPIIVVHDTSPLIALRIYSNLDVALVVCIWSYSHCGFL